MLPKDPRNCLHPMLAPPRPIPAVPGIEAAATSFGNPGALAYVLAKRQAWFTYSALNGANVLLMDN
jgi:hypothetical protein